MPTYKKMQTVPIKWLHRLPSHWQYKKLGALFIERKEKVSDKLYPPLSVTKFGIVPQLSDAVKTDNGDDRKLVKKGDIVINSRSDRKGACGLAPQDGSVSLINIVLIPKNTLNPQYIHYLLRSIPFSEEFFRYGTGIVDDLWSTRYSEMKNISLPIPPLTEQVQISHYLNWKILQINDLIKNKKKQIRSLGKYLNASIEKQLTQFPILKTSRLKFLGQFHKGSNFSKDNLVKTSQYPAILYGDIYTQYDYKTSIINHFIDKETYESAFKLHHGDIVMTGTGETKDEIGKAILYLGSMDVAVGGDIITFRPHSGLNKEYLLYQLYSQQSLYYRYIHGKGDIIVHISASAIGNMTLFFPSPEDQTKAVNIINAQISRIKELQKDLYEEITLLEEYKTKLISDAVTGQIDVRNIKIPQYEHIEEVDLEEQSPEKEEDMED